MAITVLLAWSLDPARRPPSKKENASRATPKPTEEMTASIIQESQILAPEMYKCEQRVAPSPVKLVNQTGFTCLIKGNYLDPKSYVRFLATCRIKVVYDSQRLSSVNKLDCSLQRQLDRINVIRIKAIAKFKHCDGNLKQFELQKATRLKLLTKLMFRWREQHFRLASHVLDGVFIKEDERFYCCLNTSALIINKQFVYLGGIEKVLNNGFWVDININGQGLMQQHNGDQIEGDWKNGKAQ